jgi:alanine-glyoxylate transaminase/serine-glyoxylate transaminase/serine-pyruvate transaminase
VPDRVLRAIDRPIIDHRGPEFVALTENLLKRLKAIFKTSGPVLVFPASGSGGWEAALVNTLSPGDHVLMFDQGFFANGWKSVAERHELQVDVIPHDWRCAVDANQLAEKLAADKEHIYRAVLIVHNETSTGVASDIASVREALNHVGHPALLMVDTVSSLASMNYCHDAWGVDPGAGLQRCQRKSLGSQRNSQTSPFLLGLATYARSKRGRVFPLHSGDEPNLWPA